MAHILIMPRQGNTVESCILVNWKVKEGDSVTGDAAVCDVETDKAAFEVPAGASGTVLKILRAAGDDVPVLEPIAVIGAAGEDWQAALGVDVSGETSRKDVETQRNDKEEASRGGAEAQRGEEKEYLRAVAPLRENNPGISPRARNLAAKEALPPDAASGTGPGGRIIERDITAALRDRPALTAAAKALGSTALPAHGSGLGGRITAADLASPIPGPQSPIPLKGIRKVIADRMYKSLAETAQFTLNASAPVSRLQDIRSRMKSSAEETGLSKITVNDLVLFTVSRVLPRFPYMNAHKIGDKVMNFDQVHLGVAVDTPRGLMVPVIRNANLLSLTQISSEAKRLAAACQNGAVKPDEISGSTFTVTNMGSLGISSFTPILNIPEVAILGVCGIELKPREIDGKIDFEPHIGFSLTINHQVVDGAPAARFLKALGEAIADIDLTLIKDLQNEGR